MSAVLDYLNLCRLCLVKDKVNIAIFDETTDVRQLFLKISACLPVKVAQDDRLPKKICDSCLYKVDLLYQFWNTTISSEKQLLQWCGGGSGGEGVPIKGSDDTLMLPQSHAHPHSIHTETIILKEERLDSADTKLVDDEYGPDMSTPTATVSANDLYSEEFALSYQQQQQLTEATSNYTSSTPNQAQKKRPRGRPPGSTKKKRQSTRSKARQDSVDDSDDDRPLAAVISEPEDHLNSAAGLQITKVEKEAESDEDYVDNSESLEPTTFVAVPSTSACELPGPSGIVAKGTTSTEPGHLQFDEMRINVKDPIGMEPIVTIVELPAATDWRTVTRKRRRNVYNEHSNDDDDSDDDITDGQLLVPQVTTNRRTTRHRAAAAAASAAASKTTSTGKRHKYDGYKNPFVYDHLKVKQQADKTNNVERKAAKGKSKWTCLICNKNLTGKKDLIDHYSAHKEDKVAVGSNGGDHLPENEVYQCDVCLKEFTSEKRFEKHMETHNDSRFNCEYCEKSFKRPYEYAVHMRFHSNDDKLRCHVCEYSTTYNSALRTHIKRHEAEYKYRCELCGKGFFVHTWFEEHKNYHTGAKPFTCDSCGKQFAYTRYLMAHKRSMHPECYTDVPVINECQFCQKRFAHKKSLLLHVRSHTGENTVLCDICGKRLSSNDHLKLHRRIHTGYKPFCCAVCGKGFSKKCNLTLHERVHSGEKPYVCDVCGKCFSQRSTLVIHSRYHTGVRPYVCHLCNKGFVAKGVLSIHLKSCNRQNIMGGGAVMSTVVTTTIQ